MNLVEAGSPSENFLWPLDIISSKTDNTFGYVMGLRPKEYKNIPDLLNRKVEPSFEMLITAVFNLAREYQILHSKGYSYKDISDQNVFFKPDTGDVLICDNDNVSVNGIADTGVYGTMRFMAPEIVRGEARPSRNTDLYSLAVLIFDMLFISHPLEGKNEAKIHALDDNANKFLFGEHPIFIFDPDNEENRPVQGIHDNAIIYWEEVYPKFLQDILIKSFTDGLWKPEKRTVEKVWMDASIKLLDSIMICPECGAEVFYDETKDTQICWNCHRSQPAPKQIKIGKNKIVLNMTTKLKRHHLKGNYDLKTVAASVSQNPKNPAQWGLRNESTENWTYIRTDGTRSMAAPGKNAALVKGAKIDFGTIIGEIWEE
jgi:serine/threonine protein kinase